jgi:hypothetical protein
MRTNKKFAICRKNVARTTTEGVFSTYSDGEFLPELLQDPGRVVQPPGGDFEVSEADALDVISVREVPVRDEDVG